MSEWEGLTTRGGNRPKLVPRRRGRPSGRRQIMPRTKKDLQQDKQIKNVQKHIKKIINQEELNHIDTIVSGVTAASDPGTAQTILLNGLVQGNSNTTRIGDNVVYTSIQVRGNFLTDPDLVTQGTIFRLIFFWDKSPNGVAPTAANLLDNSVITRLVEAPYNSDFYKRFKIIFDKKVTLNGQVQATVAAGVTTQMTPMTLNFDLRKQMQRQSNYGLGNAGTIADISRGACYVLLLSNQTIASTFAPLVNIGVRMIYKDM